MKDFQPRWLDEVLADGAWTWRASGDDAGEPRVAFVPRDFGGSWPVEDGSSEPPEGDEAAVLALLDSKGAAFATDLARWSGLDPSRVRRALDAPGSAGTGDERPARPPPAVVARPDRGARRRERRARDGRSGRPRLGSRRLATLSPEGRWSRLANPAGDEGSLLAWAEVLLGRYGVLTRETVALDPWAPPWRELAPLLARAEMRGDVRRGYFVEGLSGVQYATEEAAEGLARLAGSAELGADARSCSRRSTPPTSTARGRRWISPCSKGARPGCSRSPANLLVLIAGRPVLIIEGYGKRLTGLASASEAEIRAALALVPAWPGRRGGCSRSSPTTPPPPWPRPPPPGSPTSASSATRPASPITPAGESPSPA